VNVTTAGTLATSAGIAAGNTLEALVGAALVNRFAGGRAAFATAPTTFRYALLAGVLSPIVSATIGVTTLVLGGLARWADFGPIWLTWWLGDLGGALVVAPVLLLWAARPRLGWDGRRAVEALGLLVWLAAAGGVVFAGWFPSAVKDYPLEFLCLPFLVWAAFRFGPRDAATGALILAGIATWGTVRGFGPFARASDNESLLLLQAFIGVVAVMTVALGAVVEDLRRVQAAAMRLNRELEARVIERTRALEASEARLLEAQEVAHIGSWEWDVGRNALWWSAELCRIYGLDAEAAAASYEAFLERVHPDDRAMVRQLVATALGDGRPFAFDHRIIRPDGSVRTLAARGRVLLDPEGRAVRLVGTGQDITDRKRAEEARTALAHERAARLEAEEASAGSRTSSSPCSGTSCATLSARSRAPPPCWTRPASRTTGRSGRSR
jgi:PAS domain S-box-containing protein